MVALLVNRFTRYHWATFTDFPAF
ncbi:hypothetical protein RSOL_507760 [Rhizoctonia solani AG-3 Rhs1AP]|uniref:Uncharacterized protein n=1 Tax=Rhizoctonia solani AG-3 Rhs1AP TaxID=1086054 RepID=X8JSI0_9AGAM|nr:hypothetical protein RSOL_507760 [Rhizoctonia solani AG-3 Rhs1AP]